MELRRIRVEGEVVGGMEWSGMVGGVVGEVVEW